MKVALTLTGFGRIFNKAFEAFKNVGARYTAACSYGMGMRVSQ